MQPATIEPHHDFLSPTRVKILATPYSCTFHKPKEIVHLWTRGHFLLDQHAMVRLCKSFLHLTDALSYEIMKFLFIATLYDEQQLSPVLARMILFSLKFPHACLREISTEVEVNTHI